LAICWKICVSEATFCYTEEMKISLLIKSENAFGADNQQGSSLFTTKRSNPSETTRRSPRMNALNEKEIYAYLHGAMHDATLNKGNRVRFGQKYPEWLKILQHLLWLVEEDSWMYKEGKNRNLYILETVCKNLDFAFDPRNLVTKGEKIAYIRGFFDAEGGIPRNGGTFYIQLVQKDLEKMETIKKILIGLGIHCGKIHNPSVRVDPDYWRFFVSRKSHKRFASTIGSWHPVKAKIFSQRMMI